MKTNSEIRRESLAKLKGNWITCIVACFVYCAVFALAQSPAIGLNFLRPASMFLKTPSFIFGGSTFLLMLLLVPLAIGIYNAFRLFWTDGDIDLVPNMFKLGFSKYLHILGGELLTTLYTLLWTLLLIVPGIIKAYAYSCVPFLLVEEPELPVTEAIKKSEDMMRGHKMDFFLMNLNFMAFSILCVLTLGIGYLWFFPYVLNTTAGFYVQVKAEYEARS